MTMSGFRRGKFDWRGHWITMACLTGGLIVLVVIGIATGVIQ
jgi:hypothetical protein